MWRHVLVVFIALIIVPLYFLISYEPVHHSHYSTDYGYTEVEALTRQVRIQVRDGEYLNVNEAGFDSAESTKPLLLFSHGFPETGLTCWKHQIVYFAKQGYRVVAPDHRGYNTSTKVNSGMLETVKDFKDLLAHYKVDKAVVIGHDWGGAAAWTFAAAFPERVQKLVILDAPHSKSRAHAPLSQLLRSWYMFFFQIPYVPEWKMSRYRWSFLINLGFGTSKPKAFSLEDLTRYRAAWSEPGALEGMIAWYRQMFKPSFAAEAAKLVTDYMIKPPTLVIFGANDVYIDPILGKISAQNYSVNGQFTLLPDASHWVTHDNPDEVNKLIHDFLLQ